MLRGLKSRLVDTAHGIINTLTNSQPAPVCKAALLMYCTHEKSCITDGWAGDWVLVVLFLTFKNYGGHCGNLQNSRLIPLPRWESQQHSCVLALKAAPTSSWFLLWLRLSTVRINSCVSLHTASNPLYVPQVDSNQGLQTPQGWLCGSSIWSWAKIRKKHAIPFDLYGTLNVFFFFLLTYILKREKTKGVWILFWMAHKSL